MEARQRALGELATAAKIWIAVSLVAMAAAGIVDAQPLDERIPRLFGGELTTAPGRTDDPRVSKQSLDLPERLRGLSSVLAAARSQAPIPSAGGAFSFRWNPRLETFVKLPQSLGSSVAERAQTLGEHTGTFSVSYSRVDFDTLEGTSLHQLSFEQPGLSAASLASLPATPRDQFADDRIQSSLDLRFGFDLVYLTAGFGVTDSVDVSLALSLARARLSARASAVIRDPDGDGASVFTPTQPGVILSGSAACPAVFGCAQDSFSDSAFGPGDVFIRTKWHIADTWLADFATAGVLTLPTGNAGDFLGFHSPTFTPWFIASKIIGRVEPHLNLGYAFRDAADVSQAEWIAGADIRILRRLGASVDFLGYHDDKRDGFNDDVMQSALGLKLNPVGSSVLAFAIQLPLNRDGLRADVAYTGQLEYTF